MARGDNSTAYWVTDTGIAIRIRLTPKASRDQVGDPTETADGAALKVHVRAIPEDGAANRALIAVIAKWLHVPKSSVTLASGARSRTKILEVDGDSAILQTTIAAKIRPKSATPRSP